MMLRIVPFLVLSASLVSAVAMMGAGPQTLPASRDRSPCNLAISADDSYAVTANYASDTASLIDLRKGVVVSETAVGKRPFCVALSKDGKRAVVSNWLSNTVTVLTVSPTSLKVTATIVVGEEPRGVAFTREGDRAYVAVSGEDAIAELNLHTNRVTRRLEVGTEPWYVDPSIDGKRLAVGNTRSQDMAVVDLAAWRVDHTVKLRGHNVRHVAVSSDGQWAYVPNIAERGRPTTKENIDLGWVIGNRLSRVPMTEDGPREAIALDPRGKAVGDLDGVALSPDGKTIAVTAGGTHEMILLRLPLPFVSFGGPEDHIDPDLLKDARRFRRVSLGGRPLGLAFTHDSGSAVIANYLSNSVQVVDVETGLLTRTVTLGPPAAPSIERQGEAIFYDAERGFNHWYSCHSCHTDGHTNGATFDTFNDGSYETLKKTLSLRGVSETAPYTWHGWQRDLRELVRNSMTMTMRGPEPAEGDLDSLMAFLKTLSFRPSRTPSDAAAAKRGEEVFRSRDCQPCHTPPAYTSPAVYTIGLESPSDAYKGFNPPSLRGVATRAPYLHDGRTWSLTEVLTKYHRPSQLNGKPDLSPQETADLMTFLRSL